MGILDLVKSFLHIDTTDTTSDTLLTNLIDTTKKDFYSITGHYLGATTSDTFYIYATTDSNFVDYGDALSEGFFTDMANGTISTIYLQKAYSSITSIYVDDTLRDTSRYIYNSDTYKITFITASGSKENVGFTKYIKITAVRGYTTEDDIPSDIQSIIAMMTVFLYKYLIEENYKSSEGNNMLTPDEIKYPNTLIDLIYNYKIAI